jgi:ABC-type nickel/cobalt efflux system permease component RcnA
MAAWALGAVWEMLVAALALWNLWQVLLEAKVVDAQQVADEQQVVALAEPLHTEHAHWLSQG